MRSFIQEGEILDLVAPAAGFTSGVITRVGAIIGVPQCTVAAGVTGSVKRRGVFELAKVSAQAWSQGQLIYLNAAGTMLTNVSATGAYLVGFATEDRANPSAFGRAFLTGAPAVAVP